MKARVPRYLHLPIQILWFDVEDIAITLVAYMFWLIIDSIWILPMVGLAPYFFMKMKATKPRGWMRHMLYRSGFVKLKGYPPPLTTKYEE